MEDNDHVVLSLAFDFFSKRVVVVQINNKQPVRVCARGKKKKRCFEVVVVRRVDRIGGKIMAGIRATHVSFVNESMMTVLCHGKQGTPLPSAGTSTLP